MANSKSIKLVITDIDGVWTDGGMYYTAEGDVMKRFSVKDGWGVSLSPSCTRRAFLWLS